MGLRKTSVCLLLLFTMITLVGFVSAWPTVVENSKVIHTFGSPNGLTNASWTVPENGEIYVTEISADSDSYVVIEKIGGEKKFVVVRDFQADNCDKRGITDFCWPAGWIKGDKVYDFSCKCLQRDSTDYADCSNKACFEDDKYLVKQGDIIQAGKVYNFKESKIGGVSNLVIYYNAIPPTPQCTVDLNCGEESSELMCSGSWVVNEITTPICEDESCSSSISYENVSECEFGCTDGECNNCTNDITNSSLVVVSDLDCIDLTHRNQSISWTVYDANSCGNFSNVTNYGYRSVFDLSCFVCSEDLQFSDWSSWSNLDCVNQTHRNQERSRIEYDANDCGSFDDITHYEYQTVIDGSCNAPICTEDWCYGPWSACVNNLQTRTATDTNNCNTTVNRGVISRSCSTDGSSGGGSSGIIDLRGCNPIWSCSDWSQCVEDGIRTRTCSDINHCDSILNKPSEIAGCDNGNITNLGVIRLGEQQEKSLLGGNTWWIIVGIVLLIILVLIVIFLMRVF